MSQCPGLWAGEELPVPASGRVPGAPASPTPPQGPCLDLVLRRLRSRAFLSHSRIFSSLWGGPGVQDV